MKNVEILNEVFRTMKDCEVLSLSDNEICVNVYLFGSEFEHYITANINESVRLGYMIDIIDRIFELEWWFKQEETNFLKSHYEELISKSYFGINCTDCEKVIEDWNEEYSALTNDWDNFVDEFGTKLENYLYDLEIQESRNNVVAFN